jgi:hypothetical protein
MYILSYNYQRIANAQLLYDKFEFLVTFTVFNDEEMLGRILQTVQYRPLKYLLELFKQGNCTLLSPRYARIFSNLIRTHFKVSEG